MTIGDNFIKKTSHFLEEHIGIQFMQGVRFLVPCVFGWECPYSESSSAFLSSLNVFESHQSPVRTHLLPQLGSQLVSWSTRKTTSSILQKTKQKKTTTKAKKENMCIKQSELSAVKVIYCNCAIIFFLHCEKCKIFIRVLQAPFLFLVMHPHQLMNTMKCNTQHKSNKTGDRCDTILKAIKVQK